MHHFGLNCLNVLTATFRFYSPSLKTIEIRCLTILFPRFAPNIEVNRDNLSRVELVQQRAFVLGKLELKILRILALRLQDELTLCELVGYLYGISFDKQSAICCVLFCTHCVCVAESQLVYVVILCALDYLKPTDYTPIPTIPFTRFIQRCLQIRCIVSKQGNVSFVDWIVSVPHIIYYF